jgi:hypothetical protein
LFEVVNNNDSIILPNGYRVPEALCVAVSVDTAVIPAGGLLVVAAMAAKLAIVLAVPHAHLKVIDPLCSIVPLNVGRVMEALLISVSIRAAIVQIAGLLMVVTVAAKLAIVLAVLHALLKVPSLTALLVIAIWILVAILILALVLRGNRGIKTRSAEPGDGNSNCQHP